MKSGSSEWLRAQPQNSLISIYDLTFHRFQLYKECSTHEFLVQKGDENWRLIEVEFINFIRYGADADLFDKCSKIRFCELSFFPRVAKQLRKKM